MIGFETGSWIHSHTGKYDLSQSGMYGRISLEKYFDVKSLVSECDLKESIASINNCDKSQVVITHGATEAIFTSIYQIYETGIRSSLTNLPDYEPLYKLPPHLGYTSKDFGLFITSNPNNPTGDLLQIPEGYSAYLIDETFLMFSSNLDALHYPANTYRINTFTKFFGGDDLRVGYIIAPSREDAEAIENLRGIFTEYVSRYNISVAYQIMNDLDSIVQEVREIQSHNYSFLISNKGDLRFYQDRKPRLGTVSFIDYSKYSEIDSFTLSELLFKKSISVVPAKFFGISGPYIRVCYSRSDFSVSFNKLIDFLNGIL